MILLKKLLIFLYDFLINLIYPPNCMICGNKEEKNICKQCENMLDIYTLYKILNVKNNYYNKFIYIFKYENFVRKLILDYKFNDKAYLYEIFVKFLLKNEKICRFFQSYDIITAVPIHKKRKNQRGYNQSRLISRKIANEFENLKYEDLLEKKINTKPQSTLTKLERKENIKNVYNAVKKEKIKNKNIIILDDIYTTGSTVKECAKVLKQNGAKNIIVITIAKD